MPLSRQATGVSFLIRKPFWRTFMVDQPNVPYGGPSYPPSGGYNPPPYLPPPPQVVHVVAKPGGLSRAVGFVIGLFLFAAVFGVGMGVGMLVIAAATGYESAVIRRTYREGGSNTIAIIPIRGVINDRQAEFVHAAVDNIVKDRSVRAVVLRVDSPGGDVAASDEIWNEIRRLKKSNRPVVASYGGVAASGGYYVSCGADSIIAEETCITGSIGVIAQILTLEGLMDKIGVKPVTLVASGSPEKDVANDIFRSWTEADKLKVRTILDSAYAIFHKRVKDGRGKIITDSAKLAQIANGSIYTAQQAMEHGLIDGVGYLDDAITQAETLAGIATGSSTVEIVRQPPSLFRDGLLMQGQWNLGSALNAELLRGLANDLATPRAMYLMH
jgi:protease-4